MSTHLWLARAVSAILLIVAIAAALCAAILLPYFLAKWLANIPALVFVAILSCFLIVWAGGRVSASLRGANRGARFAVQVAGVLTLIFAVSLYWLILKPTADPGPPHPLENIRYWQLPTGSHIAYREIEPLEGTSVKPHPVIYLHGGAGAREGHFDQAIYGSLASEGFRVFLYDQAGSGMSDFLKVRDYTIVRATEDLEAIRKEIGADQIILVGHSWGARLAVKYMSKYPGRVAKVILHSPASIWRYTQTDYDYRRTDAHEVPFPKLRLLAALLLVGRNPDAAQNLVSQREAEGLLIPIVDWEIHGTVCKGDSERFPKDFADLEAAHDNPGMNPYVSQHLGSEPNSPDGDPRAALRKGHTPAILLYAQCDFIDWSGALDYRKTVPNLKTYYIPHAGHYIQFEQPELMRRIMAAFLLDQPDVIPPYIGDADPRPPATN
jgi:pimeloyl-ACP methyl ester carboxylesterase